MEVRGADTTAFHIPDVSLSSAAIRVFALSPCEMGGEIMLKYKRPPYSKQTDIEHPDESFY